MPGAQRGGGDPQVSSLRDAQRTADMRACYRSASPLPVPPFLSGMPLLLCLPTHLSHSAPS